MRETPGAHSVRRLWKAPSQDRRPTARAGPQGEGPPAACLAASLCPGPGWRKLNDLTRAIQLTGGPAGIRTQDDSATHTLTTSTKVSKVHSRMSKGL